MAAKKTPKPRKAAPKAEKPSIQTESKKSTGRGGARPGAGRKPKAAQAQGSKPAESTGRPTSFKDEYCHLAESMAKLGATDVEVADALEVDVRTLYRWKAQFPAFCQALKVGKQVADDRVERSLFSRANGYEHDEVDIRVIDRRVVQTPIRKYYPPDTTACIFWLKNRKPDDWRDKLDHEHAGKNGGPIVQATVDVSKCSVEQLRALSSLPIHAG